MRKARFATFLLIFIGFLPALVMGQEKNAEVRTDLDMRLYPFFHGVASGDPLQDRVIIWTRVTLQNHTGPVTVNWEVATDTLFSNVVSNGSTTTDASLDYTVKVDAGSLQPNTWYYYRFTQGGRFSLTGRTRTAPAGQANKLRFAVVSCSNFQAGLFNVYHSIKNRNDVDAIIHLGDYIYEYEIGGYGYQTNIARDHEPSGEILKLNDYRIRYSQYRLDHDLRELHQNFPWMIVWDDHESADNSWKGGASNHNGGEGNWQDRKRDAVQAWYEWMPVRHPNPADTARIYRRVRYGDLADILLMDTRLLERSEQDGTQNQDSSRTLVGPLQMTWLDSMLHDTSAQWKVLAQQVMVAPLEIFGFPFNEDQWDGYPKERDRLYQIFTDSATRNQVVLTGDIHTSWANDLPLSGYNSSTGANSAAVEFVTPSVTSPTLNLPIGPALLQPQNPHIKMVDLAEHGYYILDLDTARAQADWFFINDILNTNYTESHHESWYCLDGESHLQQDSVPSIGHTNLPPLVSATPPNPVSLLEKGEEISTALLGVFPVPFQNEIIVQAYASEAGVLHFRLRDAFGRVVREQKSEITQKGPVFHRFQTQDLASGVYFLEMGEGARRWIKKVVKN